MEKNLGKQILELVGGETNVRQVTRCATRLRFVLVDGNKANKQAVENLDGVISVMIQGGQFQVVIGAKIQSVYQQVIDNTNFGENLDEGTGEKQGLLTSFMNTISALFTPLLPLLAGAGLLRGLVLLSTQLGFLAETSSTYVILTSASMAVFYFLPVMLAITGAERFKANKFVAVAIMGSLIMPDFVALMGEVGNGAVSSFMGIPVVLMSYTYTAIPAIMSIYIFSKLEKFLTKIVPESIQLFMVPLVSLFVMVPLTAIVFGPIGVYIGEGIATVVNTLIGYNGWIAGAVVGGLWNILVMFGVHWAVNPIMIQNISVMGFDYLVPFTAATNFGMAGATFGVFLKTKDKKMKQFSMSALLSIFFAGITEPAIYGVGAKYKKPLIAAVIGGALGGAFMGGMGVKAYAFVYGGLPTIPAFAGPTLIYYIIGLLICFVVSTVAMLFMGLGEEDNVNNDDKNGETIMSPLKGEIKELSASSDETFSKGLLGQGIVIIPEDGKLLSPVSGTVEMVFPTKHAIGLKSNNGAEILIHVGIDTVELEGKPFEVFVEQGDVINVGDHLMNVDLDAIVKAGKSTETVMVVTNSEDLAIETSIGKKEANTQAFKLV